MIMKGKRVVQFFSVIAVLAMIHMTHSVTITGSGMFITPNTGYTLTCSYNTDKDDRSTLYKVEKGSTLIAELPVRYVKSTNNCYYLSRNDRYVACTDQVCSCDRDGMATHFYYTHTSSQTGQLNVECTSNGNSKKQIEVAEGPGNTLRIDPNYEFFTEVESTPFTVTCLAECIPSCQFKWITPNNDVRTGAILDIKNLLKSDNGTYTCKAENNYTTGGMKSLYLTVNYGPGYVELLPPETQYTVKEGTTMKPISCTADCRPSCNYTWFGPNVPIATSNILNLQIVQKSQRGVFNCTAYNDVDSVKSSDVNINVEFGPGSDVQFEPNTPSVIQEKKGKLGPITCSASCNPPCQYTWTKPDKTTINGGQLIITSLSIWDHGQFICTASNGIGVSQNKSLDVTVYYGPESVSLQPNKTEYTVTEGNNTQPIMCTADCRPACNYTWTGPHIPTGTRNVLKIQNIQKNNKGVYNCTATNRDTSITSPNVYLNVLFGPGSSLQFDPPNTSLTKQKDDKLGPVRCTAKCNPICQYKWTKPDKTEIPHSELTIQSLSIYDHGLFICTASNGIGKIQNKTIDVAVNYGPEDVILSPLDTQYTVKHGETVRPINCTAECRPACNYTWSGPNIPSDNSNVLSLSNIQKNQRGDFICKASNAVGSMESYVVKINVQYEPSVHNVSINALNFTVKENTTVVLSCKIDGNPAPYNTWKKNDKILSQAQETNGESIYAIQPALCEDNGNYSCVANNSLGISSAQQSLYVTCSPRLNNQEDQPETKIGLAKGSNLNLTVHFLAYPAPISIVWSFSNDTKGNESNIASNVKTYELYKYVTVLSKTNLTQFDFGDYILKVNNPMGSARQTYHVVPQGPPDSSTILNVSCGVQTAVLYWRTSFNGGGTQIFSIIINKKGNGINVYDTGISDEGDDNIKRVGIKLTAGEYIFSVYGQNNYGSSNSTESNLCQVKDFQSNDSDSVIGTAAGGGTAAAIVLILAILLFVLIKKRRSSKGDDGRRNLTTEDRDDDDGLRENPLYITSGETANESGQLYSIVNKMQKSNVTDRSDQGPVYSQVLKTDKRGKAGKDFEMGSVYKNSKNLRKNNDIDEVYANEVNNGVMDNAYRPTKNKDGLIYADLDLSPCIGGNKFVIRGLENKSNYAIIDLTKTAEPLPSDDEEDEKISDKPVKENN